MRSTAPSAPRPRRRSRTSGSATTSTSTTRRSRPSSTQHQMDLVDAAHLLAMGNIVTTDAGIACYDSKFFYQFWRPISGDPERRQGQQPRRRPPTRAGSRVLPVPGHPEYPSQHGCFTAAFSDTLAAALHTSTSTSTIPGGQGGSSNLTTTQHFNTVSDIQNQVVDARVWLGFHFRNSVEQGEGSATTSPTGSSAASSSRSTRSADARRYVWPAPGGSHALVRPNPSRSGYGRGREAESGGDAVCARFPRLCR